MRALFNKPRTFFERYCRLFVPQDYSTPLDALPSDLIILMSLTNKIIFDPAKKILISKGPLTENDRSMLLSNVPSGTPYHTATKAFIDKPLAPLTDDEKTCKNFFLTPGDVSRLFDNAETTTAVLSPPERFVNVLEKLLPAIQRALCTQGVVRAVANDTGTQIQDVEYVLSHLSVVDGSRSSKPWATQVMCSRTLPFQPHPHSS